MPTTIWCPGCGLPLEVPEITTLIPDHIGYIAGPPFIGPCPWAGRNKAITSEAEFDRQEAAFWSQFDEDSWPEYDDGMSDEERRKADKKELREELAEEIAQEFDKKFNVR